MSAAQVAYQVQDMEAACTLIGKAARLAPDDATIAFMQAQFAYEGWYPSVALFERALALDPGNPDLVRNFALALSSEGQGSRAQALLESILQRNPLWIDGQNTLATLRVISGDDDFCRGFAEAAVRDPGNTSLHLAWFHRLATARRWNEAAAALAHAERHRPGSLRLPRLYLDCEAGAAPGEVALFDEFAGSTDPGVALLQIRHALRKGEPERALGLAEPFLDGAFAGQFWPYCSLCWRLLDAPQATWLEGDPLFASAIDLPLTDGDLQSLARFLRSIHTNTSPYPEQSVRGGTQTERNLLLHHDPAIGGLRRMIVAAVGNWRDDLPTDDSRHPLLGAKPKHIRFSGSWSVRLAQGGHHSPHTHPQGWASSALYISVPDSMGAENAGKLAIGSPPPELDLNREPLAYIAPVPGRLVLFPSYSWHGTLPFCGEERLTVAFDVARQDRGRG